jgi:hypothetical protein
MDLHQVCQVSVEQPEVVVVLLEKQIENSAVLLCELTVSELGICNCLAVYITCLLRLTCSFAVQCVRVFNY